MATVTAAARPLPDPGPAAAGHDVRVRRSGTGLTVYCDPHGWRVHVENGHTIEELAELGMQHRGIVGTFLCGSPS